MSSVPSKLENNIDALYRKNQVKSISFLVILSSILLTTILLSLRAGSYETPIGELLKGIFGLSADRKINIVVQNNRLPRILTAIIAGGGLGLAGCILQAVLRNPLASSSTLGVSQGAAFGAAIGIIVFGGGAVTSSTAASTVSVDNPYIVTLCAFVFGSLSSLVILAISRLKRNAGAGTLILAGTALSSMFSGGSTLLQYFADDSALGAVVFWTFGNLGSANWKDLAFLAVVFVVTLAYFLFNRWNYNAMEAGADTAQSLGVNTRTVMLAGMAVCSLSAAVAVSFVGIIGFVGLIAPHIMRIFLGNDHRYLIPGSALAGALLLLLADTCAKIIMPPVILPIGALMSFVGGPMFLFLLFKGRDTRG